MSSKRMIFILLIAYSGAVSAAQYYVDSSVATNGNGSMATPWKGLSNISTNLQPGDIVSFKRNQTYNGTFTSTRSGTSSSNITFNTYGSGAAPVFNGTGNTINSLFYISHSYLTFDGFTITDSTISSTNVSVDAKIQRAFTIEGSNVTIKNCNITLVGVAMYLPGGGNTMDNCNVGNLRMVVDTDDGSQPGNDDDYGANPVVISSADNKITNNYFYDLYATSYDYDFDGGAVEFYGSGTNNNLIAYNTIVNSVGIAEVNGNSSNNIFAYNKIINAGSLLYFQSGSTYSNWQIYNNVFIEDAAPHVPESRLIGGSFGAGAVVLKNNIFQLSNGIDVANSSNITHTNNVYKLSNGSVVGYTIGATETTTSAALFTSTTGEPESWNYSPVSTLLIDKGVNVGLTKDFDGTSIMGVPDIGVEESGESMPADTISPTVSFNSPTSNASISGTVMLSATATDNSGTVSRVDFYYGATFISSDSASPFSISWNTTTVSDGSYTLNAKAFDAAGNMGTASVSVTAKNATADTTKPTVTFTSPTNGSTVLATKQLAATAADANGITKVEFYDGGTKLSTDTASPYAYNWNTTTVMNGSHTLYAKAYDPSGNVQTASVIVTVSNAVSGGDTTAPTVSIVDLIEGSTISGTQTISINTFDSSNAIKRIEIYDDTQILYVDSLAPYSFDWDTTTASDGNHTLTVKSYDAADNVGIVTVTIMISNLEPMDITNIGEKTAEANTTSVTTGGCHSNGSSSILVFLLPILFLLPKRRKSHV